MKKKETMTWKDLLHTHTALEKAVHLLNLWGKVLLFHEGVAAPRGLNLVMGGGTRHNNNNDNNNNNNSKNNVNNTYYHHVPHFIS
jgi:hypothetical protein